VTTNAYGRSRYSSIVFIGTESLLDSPYRLAYIHGQERVAGIDGRGKGSLPCVYTQDRPCLAGERSRLSGAERPCRRAGRFGAVCSGRLPRRGPPRSDRPILQRHNQPLTGRQVRHPGDDVVSHAPPCSSRMPGPRPARPSRGAAHRMSYVTRAPWAKLSGRLQESRAAGRSRGSCAGTCSAMSRRARST
jgi:hypothetical protein